MLAGLLGDSSVLVIDDDVHRERRRLMLPAVPPRCGRAAGRGDGRDRRGEHRGWPVGTDFPVAPKMSEITLEVILRTVIGATDPARLAALREVMPRLLNVGPWATLAIANRSLQRLGRGGGCAATSPKPTGCCTPRSPTAEPIPTWRRAPTRWPCWCAPADDDGGTMTDRELRDQLMTLLVAGHDTTATGLSWALERLTRHPAILARAVQAAEAGAAGDRPATSTSTRSPRRRCGSVRWCSTSAGC